MTPLCELADKYGTDKSPTHKGLRPGHSYTPFYYELFRGRTVKTLLEIGIETGASLRMWRDFFPEARIIGVDVDPRTMVVEDRITSFCCNPCVGLPAELTSCGPFDIVIDDGSHVPHDQFLTFWRLFPFVAPDGIYVIEDVRKKDDLWLQRQIHRPSMIENFDFTFPNGDDRLMVIKK